MAVSSTQKWAPCNPHKEFPQATCKDQALSRSVGSQVLVIMGESWLGQLDKIPSAVSTSMLQESELLITNFGHVDEEEESQRG